MAKTTVKVSLHLSNDLKVATVYLGSRSAPIISGCLGVEQDATGKPCRVYLDRLIHQPSRSTVYEDWAPHGAISTILDRQPASEPATR